MRVQSDTGVGPMPTSGSNRPGPMGPQPRVLTAGTTPVAIRLARLGIDTDVEARDFVYGLPSDPATPWITAWYRSSSLLGEAGVVLIGGKTTVDDQGPSAFTRLTEVVAGDIIELTGQNGGKYTYAAESIDPQAKTPNFDELLAARDADRLLLLGWDGKFPSSLANRTIVTVSARRQP